MLIKFPEIPFPDFSPLLSISSQYDKHRLIEATNSYFDVFEKASMELSDAEVVFAPFDPDAFDEHAGPEAQNIGWTLGHQAVHICATVEESACFASILARGVQPPRGIRFRYEIPWETVTSITQVRAKWEEGRRICTAYLQTFPDSPHLDTHRTFPENMPLRDLQLNAIEAMLFGLHHTHEHIAQYERTVREAASAVGGG